MKSLILERFRVDEVEFGPHTALESGCLRIAPGDLAGALRAADERLASVTVHLARPGDPTRIVCVKDVVQPRAKLDASPCGAGSTAVLEGVAVVTCGPIVGFQEGIIDMSGPGAALCAFSGLSLVALEIAVVDGLTAHQHEAALREAGLRAARWLAERTTTGEPDARQAVCAEQLEASRSLPAVAYVGIVLSQGLLHDTYVLGRDARDVLPAALEPEVFFDTGVVSGNCVSACDKNTTYHYQNHPILTELLEGHGRRWRMVGAVLSNAGTRLDQKRESAQRAVALVRELGAEGVVISKEGFGNPDADLVMLVEGLEEAGVRTVVVTDEFAGSDGRSQSLADVTPRADAVVSTGNANQLIELPPMQTVIGPLPDAVRLSGGYPHSLRADGSMQVEIQALIGATNELGFERLGAGERAP